MIDVENPPERLHQVFDFGKMAPKPGVKIFRTYDWGFAKPFSVGYWFTDYEGRLYRWAEIYGCKGPNEGLQMPTRDQGKRMSEFERERNIKPVLCIAGADIYNKPSNTQEQAEKLPSNAEILQQEGIFFHEEISKEVARPGSRRQKKSQLHDRLRLDADGLPNIQVFSTCVHWWRTVPVIPLDTLDPEDVDTDSEDHCYDDTGMVCLARPMKSSALAKPVPAQSFKSMFGLVSRRA
jgi:hypothetical protein